MITVTPSPPIFPPATVTICLSRDCLPGKIKLDWSDPGQEPKVLTFTAEDRCTKLYIPGHITGLVARNEDSDAVAIV